MITIDITIVHELNSIAAQIQKLLPYFLYAKTI
jgi:hypothetical protein